MAHEDSMRIARTSVFLAVFCVLSSLLPSLPASAKSGTEEINLLSTTARFSDQTWVLFIQKAKGITTNRCIEGETMTREARMMCGIILITVPTIQYGGYFLLTSLMNKGRGYMENPLRQNFFRAGHAHAGVIVILSLICQVLADAAVLPTPMLWFVRIGVPLAAILISSGFFFSVLPPTVTQASGAVVLIYFGAAILALAVVTLGIGLLRSP